MKVRISETLLLAAKRTAAAAGMTFTQWAAAVIPKAKPNYSPASESSRTRSVFVPETLRALGADEIRARMRTAARSDEAWPYTTPRDVLDSVIYCEMTLNGKRLTYDEAERQHVERIMKKREELAKMCHKGCALKNDTQNGGAACLP